MKVLQLPCLQTLRGAGQCWLNGAMCCCEYQLVLSGEECCHGDCYLPLSCNIKEHIHTRSSLIVWGGCELGVRDVLKSSGKTPPIMMETCRVPVDSATGTLVHEVVRRLCAVVVVSEQRF